MADGREFVIPELFPQPKIVLAEEGMSELMPDVRLATINVLPIQRKAVRSILTMSGVRVVANKKKYVVEAKVEDENSFDLSEVPADVRRDYYELRVIGSEIRVRSPYQDGMVWAAQTMAAIFHLSTLGRPLPNLLIRDWPERAFRGVNIECDWSSERMNFNNWYQFIDMLSSVKMNVLMMGIYGKCSRRLICEGSEGDFMYMPLPQVDDFSSISTVENRLRWYNVKHDRWYDEMLSPVLALQQQLNSVIVYGRERGVDVIPYVGGFRKSTSFKLLGEELNHLHCYSDPAVRKQIEKLYDVLLEQCVVTGENVRYLPLELTHIFECSCDKCSLAAKAQDVSGYVCWLGSYLLGKGVEAIVLVADRMARKYQEVINASLAEALKKAGIFERVIVQCGTSEDAARISKIGFRIWMSAESGMCPWLYYRNYSPVVDTLLADVEKNKASGLIIRGQFDPANLEQQAVAGCLTWEGIRSENVQIIRDRWGRMQFQDNALTSEYYEAVQQLNDLYASEWYDGCLPKMSAVDASRKPNYPGCVLEKFSANGSSVSELTTLAEKASAVLSVFNRLLAVEGLIQIQKDGLESLRADAMRVCALAEAFVQMLELYSSMGAKGGDASMAAVCDTIVEGIQDNLREYEQCKPDWIIPASMQPFAYIILFLYQLRDELKNASGAVDRGGLRWNMSVNWKIPEVY